MVKLAVLLLLCGGSQQQIQEYQQSQSQQSTNHVRSDIHILLVGDPGTAKSQFLKYVQLLAPRSIITNGRGSTGAGLTVAAIQDQGQWVLEAGALALADGGVCCIDEFDGIREADRKALHEAMEQQTLSVAKAGLVSTLRTQTSILAVMNFKGGKFNQFTPVFDQIKLADPLVSRFDIILTVQDNIDQEQDKAISDHIIDIHQKPNTRQEKETAEELITLNRNTKASDYKKFWSLDMIQQYIIWVKQAYNPKLTSQAENIITSYYQVRRQESSQAINARTTLRMLESLIRLSQQRLYRIIGPNIKSKLTNIFKTIHLKITEAHARLMARNEVTELDAVVAVSIIDNSIEPCIEGINNLEQYRLNGDPDQYFNDMKQKVITQLEYKMEDINPQGDAGFDQFLNTSQDS